MTQAETTQILCGCSGVLRVLFKSYIKSGVGRTLTNPVNVSSKNNSVFDNPFKWFKDCFLRKQFFAGLGFAEFSS